ncbi:PREDICTED: uncharacterized protein LOC109242810 [Nicotiana attenuata]|uniref:uncharacterized protein LOC109242810 n=1 Tax=Nicotiana attenuata TaxID=49451 RepID=UPI000905A6CE|nr:PREDICTED: uncharacterized protein LOC109242810 [Nicotiana attenuata]
MAKEIRKLSLAKVQSQPSSICDFCGIGYPTHECQASTADEVSVIRESPGNLPTDTKRNPKETINAVSLRNSKILQDLLVVETNELMGNQAKNEGEQKSDQHRRNESEAEQEDDLKKTNLKFQQGRGKTNKEVMKRSMRVHVNVPFIEVLLQIPAYAKFLKEILSNKRKVEETSVVKLTEHCSVILQNKLPQKCGDPKSFTIPCSLGITKFEKSLCDSGASINLMPLSIYKKLEREIGEIRSILVSLQLAAQTRIIPEGIVEDMLVRVEKFVFSVDFIVVNMEDYREVPLILGRPFLATGRVILDIQ